MPICSGRVQRPTSGSSSMISTYTPSGLRTHARRAPAGPTGSLSGDEPRRPSRVSVWSKSATQTPIRVYPMSHGRKSCAISRASGRSNWNISSWNHSLRSTIHQHVEATRGRPCTADASGPRIIRREPPAGQNPSPSRNHRSVAARSTTENATWVSGGSTWIVSESSSRAARGLSRWRRPSARPSSAPRGERPATSRRSGAPRS